MNSEIARANLRLVKSILYKNNIPFWLAWGTCLGAVREGNFIAHDYDIDLEVYHQDRQRVMALIPEFERQGFKTSLGGWQLYLNKDDIAFDIGFAYKTTKKIARNKPKQSGWMCDYFFLEGDFFDRLETIEFLGEEYSVPQHTTSYLAYVYGSTWQTPIQQDFWWFGKKIADTSQPLKLHSTKENLSIIKSVLQKHNIEFWLSQKTCINAVSQNENFADKKISINAYLADKSRIIEIIPELNQWGFICVKATSVCYSSLPISLAIVLSRHDELVEIEFARVPNFIKQLQGHKVICGAIDFSYNYFKKLKAVNFLGEQYYLPERTQQYLDYIYSPIWQEPEFEKLSQEEKINLLGKKLHQQTELNLVCRMPWIFTRQYDNNPNNFINEGDQLTLVALNQPIRKGIIVLVKQLDKLLIQQVTEVRENGKVSLKSYLHGQADLVCDKSEILGQIVTFRSRLGFSLPLNIKIFQLIVLGIMFIKENLKKLIYTKNNAREAEIR